MMTNGIHFTVYISFAADNYPVVEGVGKVTVHITKSGDIRQSVTASK